MEDKILSHGSSPTYTDKEHNSSKFLKGIKLDLPKYNGETDPVVWLNQVEQFFWYHGITREDRVVVTTFNLEGHAQIWYCILFEEGELSWEEFRERMICRFGPSPYDDHLAVLVKLQQNGAVYEYQIQFEIAQKEYPEHSQPCILLVV